MAFRSISEAHDATVTPKPTSLTITKPSGVVDGDVLIAVFVMRYAGSAAPSTITAPTGFTQRAGPVDCRGGPTDGLEVYFYTKIASSEPADYTWSISSGVEGLGGIVIAYSGVDDPLSQDGMDVIATISDEPTLGPTNEAPSVTTTAARDLQICFLLHDDVSDPTQQELDDCFPASLTKRLAIKWDTGIETGFAVVGDRFAGVAGATGVEIFSWDDRIPEPATATIALFNRSRSNKMAAPPLTI